jgi:predicted outer membrane lipoprotein
MIYKNGQNILGLFTVLIVGEAVINGIWIESIESRKKKTQKELDKMKAKDLS